MLESPLWLAEPSHPARVMLCILMAERSQAMDLWQRVWGRAPQGRHGHVSPLALQVGMYLTYLQQRCLQMTQVDKRLQGLDPAVQNYLGVRRHGPPVVIHEGRRAQLDAAGLPIGKPKRKERNVAEPLNRLSVNLANALTWSQFAASHLTESERTEIWAAQRLIFDRVAAGFLPACLPMPDMLTIDATGIRSFGEPPDGDVDAGQVYQTPTKRDPANMVYGYYGSAVSGRNLDRNYEYPSLAFHFALTTWHDYGHEPADVALLLLAAFGHCRGTGLIVVTDSDYPYKLQYSRRVRQLGFRPVHDLHAHDRRHRDKLAGFQTLGPEPYCPVPRIDELGSPVRDGLDLQNYNLERQEQLLYAAQVSDRDADHVLALCPAQPPEPTVRCSHHPASLQLSRTHAPTVDHPPPREKTPCCQGPVMIDLAEDRVFAKAFQHLFSGSSQWRSYWSPARTGGEGVWGNLFGENSQHAVVGLTNWTEQVRTAWAYATVLGAQNLSLLRTWWYKEHVRQRLPVDVREQLEQDPLLWPMHRLEDLYRQRFGT